MDGNEYRLKRIDEVESWLQKEIADRQRLYTKYKRAISILDTINVSLYAIATAATISGISTIAFAPAAMSMASVALGGVGLSMAANIILKRFNAKAKKHDEIHALARTKLHVIHNHVQKALVDNVIDENEFQLILEEIKKYDDVKEQIRTHNVVVDEKLRHELITQIQDRACTEKVIKQ